MAHTSRAMRWRRPNGAAEVEGLANATRHDPVAAIKFVMDQRGLSVKDLEPLLGRPNRVYEVLNRKRPVTLKMIWRLHKDLGIPAESLIRPPEETAAA